MEVHTWKERTEEGTLVYRACHHAGKWKLECAPKVGRAERDDVEWEHVELTRAHWVTLRGVLWRKYQRKRCPWRFIETIDKLLEEMPEEEGADSPMGRADDRSLFQLSAVRGMLRSVVREWLSWVYPFVCELCGRGGLDGCHVCPDCRGSFVPVEPPFCAVCGEPAEGSFIPSGLCRRCAVALPSFEEARAVYVNTGSLRDLLLAFKYGGAVHLAGSFAQMMAEAVRGNPHWFGGKKRLIVPVPMHCGKQARRGYNQAQELAVLLGEELGWPYAGVLKRLPDTLPQASLSREQRLRHARKIYAADEKRMKRSPVRGRDVLLVDDVFTTGATADSCARLLLRSGAASVCVLTLARTHHAWRG